MRLRPIEPHETTAVRLAIEAGAVAVLCLAYLWPFRLYGFDLVDEGTQFAQIARVLSGERPYVDFETGYTPGYFAFEAWLLRLGDGTIAVTRTFGVVWQAALAGGLWAILRAWSGPALATGVTALYVAFLLPVSLRVGAPFNVPYPGWIAAAAALAVQVIVARVSARRIRKRRLLLLAAGAAAGLAFSVKPNAGLLILAGALLALVPTWASGRRENRIIAGLVRVFAVLGTLVLLWPGLGQGYLVGLFLPMALAAWRAVPRFEDGDPAWLHGTMLSVGFGAVVAPWLVPLTAARGVAGVARDVFLLDGGVIEAYLLPFPAPGAAAWALALAAAGAWWDRGTPRRLGLWVVGGLTLATVAGIATGPVRASENVLLWLGPGAVLLGLADRRALVEKPREHAALAFLSVYSLQLFPRPDPVHVMMGGAPLALGTALLWRRHLRAWSAAVPAGEARRHARLALVAALSIAACRAAPAWLPRVTETAGSAGLGPRAPVVVLERHREAYAGPAALRRVIEERTTPGDAIFTFPDRAGLGFLASREQPYRFLYFVPGRPDRAGEQRAIAELTVHPPALVLRCPPQVDAFAAAPAYFSTLLAEVDASYVAVEEKAGCTILQAVR